MKTPYEMWTGKIPSINHFHIFGSKAFVLIKHKRQKKKFNTKTVEGIFLGYSEICKAYRIWIPEKNKLQISRDVKVLNKMFYNDKPKNEKQNEEEKVIEILSKIIPEEKIPIHSSNIDGSMVQNDQPGEENRDPHDYSIADSSTDVFHEMEEDNVATTEASEVEGQAMPDPVVITNERPRREIRPPIWTKDYDMSHLTESHMDEWGDAIKKEISSHLKNNTWTIQRLPTGRNMIDSKLILTDKIGADGKLERKKARLVARGFSQIPGQDFQEVFAPVTRLSSIRLLVGIAVNFGMHIDQIDICTAFLNGDIDEDIYMKTPKDLETYLEKIIDDKNTEKEVKEKAIKMVQDLKSSNGRAACKLNKAVYGLKQSGRQWYLKLDKTLKEMGFKPSSTDPCTYTYAVKGGEIVILSIYVDDILIASKDKELIEKTKREIAAKFELRDLGQLKYCLGINFEKKENGNIKLHQRMYIEQSLEKYGLKDCKSSTTPIEVGLKLIKAKTCEKDLPYQSLIGTLMYLAVATRPDISFAVSYLSQFNNCYDSTHFMAAKRVLRYLKGTIDEGLIYTKKEVDRSELLKGAADADWGSCHVDRRSYTGYIFTFAGTPVSWEARKQRTIALSTAEAEYMAITEAAKEAIYLKRLLKDLHISDSVVKIDVDNQAAQKLTKHPVINAKSKHIDIRHHFIREAVANGEVSTDYTPTNENIADFMTKALPGTKMKMIKMKVNLSSSSP